MPNELYCAPLGALEQDQQDILTFSVRDERGEGLVRYLQEDAFLDERAGKMRTYLVRDRDTLELAGYFSLKAGLASLNEEKTAEGAGFDTLPGIELANFAVNGGYTRKYPEVRGMGLSIFNDFIWPIVEDVSRRVGVTLIYVFALPYEGLIRRYGEYGFRRLRADREADLHRRLKPRYDRGCIFMFQMRPEGSGSPQVN